jgi:hypothetical protein
MSVPACNPWRLYSSLLLAPTQNQNHSQAWVVQQQNHRSLGQHYSVPHRTAQAVGMSLDVSQLGRQALLSIDT